MKWLGSLSSAGLKKTLSAITEKKHLDLVNKILQKHVPGVPVWIFGSRIKGTAKTYSDLDLVIVDQHKMPLENYYIVD